MNTAQRLLQHAIDTSPNLTDKGMKKLRCVEGYRGMPYKDTLDKPTIGVGLLLPLTEAEAMLLAACRQDDAAYELSAALAREGVTGLSEDVFHALMDAAFQLGVPKLMKFKKMFGHLKVHEFNAAAAEALDSRWARQTPKRAQHLADVLRRQTS